MEVEHLIALRLSRRKLLNPYAHLDEIEDATGEPAESRAITMERISASRKLLEDPYAHVDQDGSLSALSEVEPLASLKYVADPSQPIAASDIELAVRSVHRLLWRSRADQNDRSVDPVQLLDPAQALRLLGFKVESLDSLGQYRKNGQLIEVAGLLDQRAHKVEISGQFPVPFRRFTCSHELGHAVLHPHLDAVHRDRSLDGSELSRDLVEWQADRFATLFLMPARLVREQFTRRFLNVPFALSQDTLFALGREAAMRLREKPELREISLLLAYTRNFNGEQFSSLAQHFGVSLTAMAIRLEELGLIQFGN
jgi:Zn-dependent peptidase ImmA (M78 family)